MTLVAGLSVGGPPAFVGDLLVSRRLVEAADLPTLERPAIIPGLDDHFASGLAQKLVIVRPYLLIAWAGARAEVYRLIGELDRILPQTIDEMLNPRIILDVLDTCAEGNELVALLSWGDSVYPFGVHTRGFELRGRRIYLLGSGASDFFEYLEAHPDLFPNQETTDGLVARAIALKFGARAMALELATGGGLENSWGGGFEVAYSDRDRFRKVGDILCRAWLVRRDGSYENSGRSFFARYYGQDLYLSCFNPDEKTYIIRSPIGDPLTPLAHERVHPEWTVDTFVMESNGSFFEVARYQPPHRPVDDFVELSSGRLVAWSMNQSYVEACVETAIDRAPKGNQFEFKRY